MKYFFVLILLIHTIVINDAHLVRHRRATSSELANDLENDPITTQATSKYNKLYNILYFHTFLDTSVK